MRGACSQPPFQRCSTPAQDERCSRAVQWATWPSCDALATRAGPAGTITTSSVDAMHQPLQEGGGNLGLSAQRAGPACWPPCPWAARPGDSPPRSLWSLSCARRNTVFGLPHQAFSCFLFWISICAVPCVHARVNNLNSLVQAARRESSGYSRWGGLAHSCTPELSPLAPFRGAGCRTRSCKGVHTHVASCFGGGRAGEVPGCLWEAGSL
jgi:hypothetical protein